LDERHVTGEKHHGIRACYLEGGIDAAQRSRPSNEIAANYADLQSGFNGHVPNEARHCASPKTHARFVAFHPRAQSARENADFDLTWCCVLHHPNRRRDDYDIVKPAQSRQHRF
jgi:hypothetical protein